MTNKYQAPIAHQSKHQPITKTEATDQAMKNLELVVLDDRLDEARYEFMAELDKNIPAKAS